MTASARGAFEPAAISIIRGRIEETLASLVPENEARAIAAVANPGSAGPVDWLVIIEARDFFARRDGPELEARLAAETGQPSIAVRFAPLRFLSRDDAGAIDHDAAAAHWRLHEDAVNLREAGDREWAAQSALSGAGEVLSIVSLADLRTVVQFRERHRRALTARIGVDVNWEHVCLPISPVLLSDLIFHDYFQPRLPQDAFASIDAALAKLRRASLIIVDDGAEMAIGGRQVVGALSHAMRRAPEADLIAVRRQRYAASHHQLPLTVVSGADLRLRDRTAAVDQLALYLRKPIFRIAGIESFASFTEGWDYRPLSGHANGGQGSRELDPDRLVDALADWIKSRSPAPVRCGDAARMIVDDLGHYCSHMTSKADVDKALATFGSFCIAGQRSSIPYIARELERLGKAFSIVPDFSPSSLAAAQPYECLLICGAQGHHPILTPAAAIMKSTPRWRTQGFDDPALADLKFTVDEESQPHSFSDWHYAFPLDRSSYSADFADARNASPLAPRVAEARRRERLAARSQDPPPQHNADRASGLPSARANRAERLRARDARVADRRAARERRLAERALRLARRAAPAPPAPPVERK